VRRPEKSSGAFGFFLIRLRRILFLSTEKVTNRNIETRTKRSSLRKTNNLT
jgi:hypothetical protein